MKLLYVQDAKATWLFDTRLINPRGLALGDFFASLKDRYRFATAPINEYDRTDKGSLAFQGGSMPSTEEPFAVSLTIFKDGIVGHSLSNTDHATAFLEDLRMFSFESGFSVPEPSAVIRGFVSVLVVETELQLFSLNPKLFSVVEYIQSKMVTLDNKPREFDLSRIAFSSEDMGKALAPVAFTFERRIEQPFSSNLYYSEAPLQTQEHIELLDMLEEILTA
jgi:hypothetical protein